MTDTSCRVAELLDHLQRGDERRFNDFCTALEGSDQLYIVEKYLKCCSQARDEVDIIPPDPGDMPLSRQNSSKLTACWNTLIDKIDSDGLLLHVHDESFRVFSDSQIRKLRASNLHLYS